MTNANDHALAEVMARGCWTPVERFNDSPGWSARALVPDASRFEVFWQNRSQGEASWELAGVHNMHNALAAVAAARHAGVPSATALAGLAGFRSIRRRLEGRGVVNGVTVYDDFAHHPTAIAATLAALRARVGGQRILAVLEPRSNTMKLGVHRDTLAPALGLADRALLFRPADLGWDLGAVVQGLNGRGQAYDSVEAIVEALASEVRRGDHILIMSNGGFDNIHPRLLARLGR